MCSIFGSFDYDMFIKLAEQNQRRGKFSYSIAVIDPNTRHNPTSLFKEFGPIDFRMIPPKNQDQYYIGHVQAPTGGAIKDIARVHPSHISGNNWSSLWHNGMLKDSQIKELQKELNINIGWDTQLLHMTLINNPWNAAEILSNIGGSFGCVWIVNDCFNLFTNQIVQLFYDDDFNLSSTKFENSKRLPPDNIYQWDLINRNIKLIDKFTSKSNPYFGEF